MLRALGACLAYAYVSFVGLTTRLRVVRGDRRERLRARDRRFIYAFWHQRQIYLTYLHRGAGAAVLVSRSRDGELIAKILELSRLAAIRGSSSRGGASAVRAMAGAVQSGLDIAITPDGPRGPAREVKEGALFLARSLGIPILPLACALSRKIVVKKAWDRFHFPLPFGRAAVVYAEPIEVLAHDDLKAKAAELKAVLDRITDEADALVS